MVTEERAHAKRQEELLRGCIDKRVIPVSISAEDLKGSPPDGGESGRFADLHPKAGPRMAKAAASRKNVTVPVPASSSASTAVPSSASASSPSLFSDRSTESASARKTRRPSTKVEVDDTDKQGTRNHKLGDKRAPRPWQELGREATISEVEQPDECIDIQPSRAGVAESAAAREQVLAAAEKTRAAAWVALKKEFSVQKSIWESLALMKKAQMAAAGTAATSKEPVETVLLNAYVALLSKVPKDVDGAVGDLEETLDKNEKEYNILSKSMRDSSKAAIDAEALAKKRRTLANALEAAAAASPRVAESPKTPKSPLKKDKALLEELSSLLLFCDLGRRPLTYIVRRILCWSLGAPESGLVISLSSAWATTAEDLEDPWMYCVPDPSISDFALSEKSEGTKDARKSRADLSSLSVKNKKQPSKQTSPRAQAVSSKSTAAILTGATVAPDDPPPSLPPPARLPDFPRYRLADPLSCVPVGCYPTGLAKSQRSTSPGGGSTAASNATCGSGAESCGDHRKRVFLSL